MNHSCSPNCYCPLVRRTGDRLSYDAMAVQDIHPGDEITCDYALFDYDCNGHEIAACHCEAPNCRGSMRGFRSLSLAEKVRVMPYVDNEIVARFLAEEADAVRLLDSTLPDGIALRHGGGDDTAADSAGTALVATRKFAAGDVVYANRATILSKDDSFESRAYILKVDDNYVRLNSDSHFIHRPGNYAECLGFDSFQNHSCDPNTYQVYHDESSYTVYAGRDIVPGDTLETDYMHGLENQSERLPSLPTVTFRCQCGTTKCRGVIVA
jgi:SET domain